MFCHNRNLQECAKLMPIIRSVLARESFDPIRMRMDVETDRQQKATYFLFNEFDYDSSFFFRLFLPANEDARPKILFNFVR